MRAVSAEERHPAVFQRKSQACLCAVLGCTAAPYPCPVVTHSSNPGMGGDANASDTASKGDRTMQLNSTKRRLRNSWIPWVTAIVLSCFSNAVAQARYKVTDLGAEGNDNLGCAMSVNSEGWTEIMAGNLPPGEQDNIGGTLLNGRALIDVDGFKFDL